MASFQKSLDWLAKSGRHPFDSFDLLRTLLKHIIEKPAEPKFRKLSRQNKILAERLFDALEAPGAEDALLAVGFVNDPTDTKYLVLPASVKLSPNLLDQIDALVKSTKAFLEERKRKDDERWQYEERRRKEAREKEIEAAKVASAEFEKIRQAELLADEKVDPYVAVFSDLFLIFSATGEQGCRFCCRCCCCCRWCCGSCSCCPRSVASRFKSLLSDRILTSACARSTASRARRRPARRPCCPRPARRTRRSASRTPRRRGPCCRHARAGCSSARSQNSGRPTGAACTAGCSCHIRPPVIVTCVANV
jgi:hypothetical protein